MKGHLKLLTLLLLLGASVALSSSCQRCDSESVSTDVDVVPESDVQAEPTEDLCADVQDELNLCHGRIDALCDAIETKLVHAFVASRSEVGETFTGVCGGIEVRVDHFDEKRGWVHLAYKHQDTTRYGHRMVLEEAKADRNVLFVRDSEPPQLLILDGCDAGTCTVRCLPIFGEVPACGTSLLPLE